MSKKKYKRPRIVHKDERANRKLELKYKILFPETADRLWAFRETHGMSQKEMAEEIGMSAGTISKLECGYTQSMSKTLAKIARNFGLSVDYLLNLSDSDKIHSPVVTERRSYK